MQNFQDIEHFVKTLSAAIKKKIPTKVSQLANDVGYKTTDTDTTYKLSKSGSTVTLTGSDGSTTSVTDDNTTYSSLKNPYSLDIQNNGTTVASYDGSTAKTANFTNATTSANGLMSAADKSKLDGVDSTYATKSELSSHSQNTSNPHKVTASQVGALPLSGGSLTGKLTVPSIETGSANANYFQTRKMRGEGDANTYYHAIDFGYAGHNRVDFYEYGGKYVFHRYQGADTVIGEINGNGFVGKVNGHTINADVPANAQFTDTTYSVATSSTDGLMSKSDKAKLDGMSSNVDEVTIKTVKVNGTALAPDSNKAVNVTVPTLANNATTTTGGMALDARMGKTLSDQISSVKAGVIDQIVNLTAAGWTGDAAPYSQTVNVTGMTEDLLCELFSACPKSATVAERKAYNKAYAIVASGYAETADGKVTFSVDEKPAIDIGVRIKSISKANAISDQTSSDITSAVDAMSNTLEGRITSLWKKIYPVGSIYISANSTSPAELFGGTWEQIKDRFLLSAGDAYTAGSTGGEVTHALTVDEMPSHRHSSDSYQYGYPSSFTAEDNYCTWVNNGTYGNNEPNQGESGPVRTSFVGGSKPHNNMPPYLAVYMWRRVA